MNGMRLAMLVTIAVALPGCAVFRSIETGKTEPWVKPGMSQPANDLESLLLYFAHIKELPAAELGNEHDNARLAFTEKQSDFNRVRLAMLLSLPNTEFYDNPGASDLLDPMLRNEDSILRGLALLISVDLQERRRLDGRVQSLQQNVKSLQQNVQGLQQNMQGLQQKLDALKSLEKSMTEREQSLQQNMQGLQQKLDALKSLEKSLSERGPREPRRTR